MEENALLWRGRRLLLLLITIFAFVVKYAVNFLRFLLGIFNHRRVRYPIVVLQLRSDLLQNGNVNEVTAQIDVLHLGIPLYIEQDSHSRIRHYLIVVEVQSRDRVVHLLNRWLYLALHYG